MAMKYDPTAYETWRQNFELRQSLAWFAGFAWYLIWGGGSLWSNGSNFWLRSHLRLHGALQIWASNQTISHDPKTCRNAAATYRL